MRADKILQLLALSLVACHGAGSGQHGDAGVGDAGVGDLAGVGDVDLAGVGSDFGPGECVTPSGLTRGVDWVRKNPPMVSALTVSMGTPPFAAVNDYFDSFHANTVHLWATGLPTEIAGWNAAAHPAFRYISWVQADGTSAANGLQLGGVAPLPGRIGYQLGDEPQDMTTLTTMLATAHAIRTAGDPYALLIINVNDQAIVDTLRPVAIGSDDIDVLSYDNYSYKRSGYPGLDKVRSSALTAMKPYWRYTRAYFNAGGSPESTDADLRWDAFVGQVFGFSGLTWFLYNIEPTNPDLAPLLFMTKGDWASAKTSAYSTVATLNQQLVYLGKTTALLRSVEVRYASTIPLLNPGLPEWSAGAGGDHYLSKVGLTSGADALLGFFTDDCSEPYVILQNARHPGAEFPNSSDQPAVYHLEFDFSKHTDPTLDPSQLISIDMTSGGINSIALSGTGDLRTVDVSLPAGGVVIWKYKNAHPLARQP